MRTTACPLALWRQYDGVRARLGLVMVQHLSVITEKASFPDCTIHREWVRLTCVRLRFSAKSGRPDSNRRRPAWEASNRPMPKYQEAPGREYVTSTGHHSQVFA